MNGGPMNSSDQESKSNIGKHLALNGTIVSSGAMTISGRLKGRIEAPSQELVVSESAQVEANITAGDVMIEGRVRGNVKGSRRATLVSTANLAGKLETRELRVEEGAVFRGQVDIIT